MDRALRRPAAGQREVQARVGALAAPLALGRIGQA